MTNVPKVFQYIGNEVRTILKNGDVWFVAKDVCDILEIGNPSQALARLDDDEKNTIILNEGIGNPNRIVVNEPGLYNLIFGSRKREAKDFKRWVTHEVIPAIRKHGGYLTAKKVEEALADPDTIIMLATRLKEERAKKEILQQKREMDRPKVLFAEAFQISNHSILIGELARLLKQNGVDIGQNRLFAWMRDNGYLIRRFGEEYNNPTQRSMDMKLFEIKKRTITNPDGSVRVTRTTVVTGKGQQYFIHKFIHSLV